MYTPSLGIFDQSDHKERAGEIRNNKFLLHRRTYLHRPPAHARIETMSFLYAKFGKAVIVGEVAVLGATYYVYRQLTIDEAYRKRMEENMPWFMDAFHTATQNTYKESPSPVPEILNESEIAPSALQGVRTEERRS